MKLARSPRIVPGVALMGLVTPIIVRHASIASGPSITAATSGPPVMKLTRSPKERLLGVLGVVGLRSGAVERSEFEGDELRTPSFDPPQYFADESATNAVGFNQDKVRSLIARNPN